MNDQIRVDFLRGISMHAPDMVATSDFYSETWGLSKVPSDDGTVYFRGTGGEPYIYSLTDGDSFGIEYVNFGMISRSRVDQLYSYLADKQADLLGEPELVTTPGGGYGFSMRDPDDRILRIVADVDEHTHDEPEFALPVKVSHVVLNTPNLKITEAYKGFI